MTGMDAATGKPLAGDEHLRQSLARILSTPIGTRIARREFGSLLPELVDQPMNAVGRMRLFAATALAVLRWEPRLKLTAIALDGAAEAGSYRLTIDGVRTDVAAAIARTRLVLPLTLSGATA
jgi:hypothetical protein